MIPRDRLPATIVGAIVLLWINIAIGVVLLARAPADLLDLAWIAAYLVVAVGLQRRERWARLAGLLVTGLAYAIGLAQQGTFFSTTLLAFLLLLVAPRSWPASRPPAGHPAATIPPEA